MATDGHTLDQLLYKCRNLVAVPHTVHFDKIGRLPTNLLSAGNAALRESSSFLKTTFCYFVP
jgi:hypothetical protein